MIVLGSVLSSRRIRALPDRQISTDRQGGTHCFLESCMVWSRHGGTNGARMHGTAGLHKLMLTTHKQPKECHGLGGTEPVTECHVLFLHSDNLHNPRVSLG